jgi:hypothetical protein
MADAVNGSDVKESSSEPLVDVKDTRIGGNQFEPQPYDAAQIKEKWGGYLILGPLPIAMMAIAVIISGSYVTSSSNGFCGYPLNEFVYGAIATAYLFLFVYSWIFVGHEFKIRNIVLLSPFTTLSSLVKWYSILLCGSTINFGVGTIYVIQSSFCANTSPSLYYFSYTIICGYWIILLITVATAIKKYFNISLVESIKSYDNVTVQDIQSKLFNEKFKLFVVKGARSYEIPTTSFGPLLAELYISATVEDITQWTKMLDPSGGGVISKDVLYKWYALKMAQDK